MRGYKSVESCVIEETYLSDGRRESIDHLWMGEKLRVISTWKSLEVEVQCQLPGKETRNILHPLRPKKTHEETSSSTETVKGHGPHPGQCYENSQVVHLLIRFVCMSEQGCS